MEEITMNRLLRGRQGDHARADVNLVVPLAGELPATDRRIRDTADSSQARSRAVTRLETRPGDVESTNRRSTLATRATPGIRTSTMATRTTITRTTSSVPAPSADLNHPSDIAEFSFTALVQAYIDCRRTKRNTANALAFEQHLERNLCALHDELLAGRYSPGRSICFAITRPKPREVWAADFRDRIVHHLLYNHIGPTIERTFIADSCACIPGRGTLYAARRLEHKVRSITQNWMRPAYYLKLDLANFFVSIDKRILADMLAVRIPSPWWQAMALQILRHDPRTDVDVRGGHQRLALIPPHKSLFQQPSHLGLPIGNLSSQFFANVYLDAPDKYVKQGLRCRHYIRYVDDFILLNESPQQLNAWHDDIAAFLPRELYARLNPTKTILQPIARGIDFAGQVIKPWRRTLRRRTFNEALSRVYVMDADDVYQAGNSYFGLLRQATQSHADRARLANVLRRRGHAVNRELTKGFP
jgi:retron-type reverse transcriptase